MHGKPSTHRPHRSLAVPAVAAVAFLSFARADEVDDYVTAEIERQKVPGISIAVLRNGEIVKARGYGLANVEHGVPATERTIFQSGSVGKQFTATLVMLLVEEGTKMPVA